MNVNAQVVKHFTHIIKWRDRLIFFNTGFASRFTSRSYSSCLETKRKKKPDAAYLWKSKLKIWHNLVRYKLRGKSWYIINATFPKDRRLHQRFNLIWFSLQKCKAITDSIGTRSRNSMSGWNAIRKLFGILRKRGNGFLYIIYLKANGSSKILQGSLDFLVDVTILLEKWIHFAWWIVFHSNFVWWS